MSAAERGDAREVLLRFLQTDDRDTGCEMTMQLLDVYVEQVADGVDPEAEFPGITAHLRTCQPCAEDRDGLLAAVRADLSSR